MSADDVMAMEGVLEQLPRWSSYRFRMVPFDNRLIALLWWVVPFSNWSAMAANDAGP